MKQEIKDYSQQISDLRKTILESIREMLRESGEDCVELCGDDVLIEEGEKPVNVIWFDNSNFAYEGEARALILDRGKISLELFDSNEKELIEVHEYDYALRDIDTLNNLYVALQTKLNENGTNKQNE